jgi:hypothetical protein
VRLIFLYGLPATGKLTVGRELAALTGYGFFHNHLAVDLLLSVFEFGSPSFVELREQIWLSVFERASDQDGLIFTFAPEATVRPDFIERAQAIISRAGGEVLFVELTCPVAELKQRLASAPRSQHGKLTSVELFDQLAAQGSFDSPRMPPPRLTVDTSLCSPRQAAERIAQVLAIELLKVG